MGVIIEESGMQLGEYEDDNVFNIEKCAQYTENLRQMGIKSCEIIVLKSGKLCFVEAKKSCPNQLMSHSLEEKRKKYDEYVQDIVEKMRHSLNLYANILLERYSQDGVPERMQDIKKLDICFVLIVKNAEKAWLDPFRDKFSRELKKEMRIWKIPDFLILNEEQARKKKFIL